MEPQGRPTWDAYYRPWARITLHDPAASTFDLEYMRYTRKWQRLDFVGLLEDCVHEIARDRAGVFFPTRRRRCLRSTSASACCASY